MNKNFGKNTNSQTNKEYNEPTLIDWDKRKFQNELTSVMAILISGRPLLVYSYRESHAVVLFEELDLKSLKSLIPKCQNEEHLDIKLHERLR